MKLNLKTTVLWSVALWVSLITLLHLSVNLGVFSRGEDSTRGESRFRIGYLPVTCHLTCPVADFITRNIEGDNAFEPVRFSGWPELKEAFLAGYTPSTFILAPMAIALREQGVPVKIVYLGHRDGTAMMVHRESLIFRIQDLKGKTIAIPNRFSNQHLLLYRALKERGMTIRDVNVLEMPPPDMPAALYARAIDAFTAGEPFPGQTEMDGYGRVLYLTKDVWPNFISCVLAVHEDMISHRQKDVQRLVDGIARSGKWLDERMDNRMAAAEFVSRNYYNQHPRLLQFVLSKPPDRVRYTNLELLRKEFEEIEALGLEAGILGGTVQFEDYADSSFVRDEAEIRSYPLDLLSLSE